MKFLSPEVALCLYKPTIQPCMEYCCNVWAVAPSCYLELLDKLQKWKYRSIGPSLAAYLKSLNHRRNVFSIGITLVDVQSQLVLLPYFSGRSTRYSDRLHDFSATFPRCYKYLYDNSFFSLTGKSWHYLPIE